MTPPSVCILSVCLLLLPSVARGEEAPPAADAVQVPEIEVTTDQYRKAVPARESVSGETVVEPAVLESPSGPIAAVREGPAVSVRESGGPGHAAMASVRGSDARSTLLALDGVVLNSPFMGGADLNSLSLLTLDSVTTVRGGQGALRGNDSAGGTVDAVTPSVLEWGDFTRASLMAGSMGTVRLKAAHAHLFRKGTPVGVMASAGFGHSAGDFAFVDSNNVARQREHNSASSVDALLKVESAPAGGHRLDAFTEFFAGDRDIAGLEQFPSLTARQRDMRAVAGLAWSGPRLFGVRGYTAASAWFRFLKFDYLDASPQMGAPVDTTMQSSAFGASFEAVAAPISRLAVRLAADGGGVFGAVRRSSQSGYSPGRGNVAAVLGIIAGAPDDPWQLSADVRLEFVSGIGFSAVPSLGIWYEPHPMVRLAANVGRSYRLPTLEELYFDTGFVQGNPDLDPEDSVAWDFGIEVGRGRWWNFGVSYFENYGFNMIMFAPVSAFVIKAQNSGSAVLRGVEACGKVRWKWLEAGVLYTWLFSRLDSSGTAMPARPAHSVSGTVAATGGPFRLAIIPSWQSGFFLDSFESVAEEGRFRLDLRLEIRPRPFIVLAADFMNVTDKKDSVDFLQQPLPGFSAFGTVRIEL